jgi:hypothetical protein
VSNDEKTQNMLEDRLNKLEQENQSLKNEIKQERNKVPEVPTNYDVPQEITYRKFVFVKLIVQQRELKEFNTQNGINDMHENVNYTICSKIIEVGLFTETEKYQLLDKVQTAYINSANAQVYEGKVLNRQCYEFNTYEEASKQREKFTM